MALNPALTGCQYKVLRYLDIYTRREGGAPTVQEIADHFRFSKPTALLHLRALERKGAIRRTRYAARTVEILVPSALLERVKHVGGKKGRRQFVNLVPTVELPATARHGVVCERVSGRGDSPAALKSCGAGVPPVNNRGAGVPPVNNRGTGVLPVNSHGQDAHATAHRATLSSESVSAMDMAFAASGSAPVTSGRQVESRQIKKGRSGEALPSLSLRGTIAAGKPIEAIETKEVVNLAEMFPLDKDCFMLHVKGDSMIDEQIRDGDFVVVEKRPTAKNGELVVALLDNDEATLKRFYMEKGRVRLQPANLTQAPILANNVRIQGVVVGVLRKY